MSRPDLTQLALASLTLATALSVGCASDGKTVSDPASAAAEAEDTATAEEPETAMAAEGGPPVARQDPRETTLFGTTLVDPYHWLRDRESPEVIEYLEAENRYSEDRMAHTEELQDELYRNMRGRIKEDDASVPYLQDGDYYYERTEEGQQYKVYCRRRGSLDAEEEVLLDANALARDESYFDIGIRRVSPDGRLLAYGVDTSGAEAFTIRFKDLASGELLPDEIEGAYYGLQWSNDSRAVFYTRFDHAHRPDRLYRHILGTDSANDELLYQEKDEAFFLGIGKTRSGAYLLLELGSAVTSEVHLLDADRAEGDFQVFAPRRQGVEYTVDHQGDRFLIRTNEQAKNFRLLETPLDDTRKTSWRELVPHREGVRIEWVEAFADHLVLVEREGGLRHLAVTRLADGAEHRIDFPEPIYSVRPFDNHEYESATIRMRYSSMVTPASVFDYDLESRSRELLKQTEVLGGFDPGDYTTERVWARADDGTEIPISLLYQKGLQKDGSHPILLYGYGSYGANLEANFRLRRFALVDRGVVFAIAHIRGGGEMGEQWHDDGKLLNKRNTFTDFIAAGEHLVAQGYGSRDRLAGMGGSAGGLLIGAVSNLRPDLFRALVAQVPFVDVMNTMLDASIPLTVIEWEEWGNPNEEESFHYMRSYSPYDNVEAKDYPALLVTAGLYDPRVGYWEPAKWVARLRATRTGDSPLLLRTNMGAGHGGASGRFDAIRERAFEYAFVLDMLEVGP